MATVKILFRKDAPSLEQYIFSHREPDDPVIFGNCMKDFVSDKFLATQMYHGKEGVNQAIHIIQSWHPNESNLFEAEKYTEMGRKLVESNFPGHEFCVVTHTSEKNLHNHIMINPVNWETGKRIKNKKEHFYELKAKNDQISRKNELSVIEINSREQWEKIPNNVKEMTKRGGFSYLLDLKDKSRFALSVATSFDEYMGILNHLGIEVKVRGKTISYRSPGRKRFLRLDKHGSQYRWEEVIEKFRSNDLKLLQAGIKNKDQITDKDYTKFHKFNRDEENHIIPPSHLNASIIPLSALKKGQEDDIIDYCKKHHIKLFEDTDGSFRLSGREYIKITKSKWENEKNQTSGKLIELLVNHQNISYLDAYASLSEDEALKSLCNILENSKPHYHSFYIPKDEKNKDRRKSLFSIINSEGLNPKLVRRFINQGQFKVFSFDRVRFYPFQHRAKSLSFYRKEKGKWFTRRTRGLTESFFDLKRKRGEIFIFDSPLCFLKSKGMINLIEKGGNSGSVIVPLEPIQNWLNDRKEFLSSFEKLTFVSSQKERLDQINIESILFKDMSKEKKGGVISVEEFDDLVKKLIKEKRIEK